MMILLQEAANSVAATPGPFQQIIDLLEVIIWPLTVFGGLLLFRKHFSKLISSLGSIKAGTQGFEMNFIEDKLENAAKLIGIGSTDIISKDGAGIIPKDGAGIIPKGGSNITPKSEQSDVKRKTQANSPYQELIELEDAINQKLKSIAQQNGISVTGSSNFAIVSELTDRNVIDNHMSDKLKSLIELNSIGLSSPKMKHEQISMMKKMFNNIPF
jgi:hypothetical protein